MQHNLFSFEGGSREYEGDSVSVRRHGLGSLFVINGRLRQARSGFTFVLYVGLDWATGRPVMLALAEEPILHLHTAKFVQADVESAASGSDCRLVAASRDSLRPASRRTSPRPRSLRLRLHALRRAGYRKA